MSGLKYLSVCSGIEAATVAWHPLGWQPVAFAEIKKFPSAVLTHHYPTVPNWGDITRFREWPDANVDVLVGGTPCQSFSVAGLRQGLRDPRGNLALVYLAIADRYRPEWVVWENVPGVLSSNGGRDFGAFLGGLAELGYGWAYRVLDAQYTRVESHPRAVPQRRRRVFVVGCLGDWRRAAAVLLEPESLSGHPAPRRTSGQDLAPATAPSLTESGRGVARVGESRGQDPLIPEVAWALQERDAKGADSDTKDGHLIVLAFNTNARPDEMTASDVATLTRSQVAGVAGVAGVRRLTPTECERLMGLPDGYTLVPYRGKPAADGPRYKALGNSIAINCLRWIGERLSAVSTGGSIGEMA